MKPPFQLTQKLLNLCTEIAGAIGRLESLPAAKPTPNLRRQNRIRSVQASLAIEGNTLDLDAVTAVIDQKRILGPQKDILEVQNAIRVYEHLSHYDPYEEKSLLRAHGELMKGLAIDAGRYRSGNIGILKGSQVAHMAPKPLLVPKLMGNLFSFVKEDAVHPLIRACVFHYELEFIHPFSDGNGRMGRLWQTVLLCKFHPLFEFIPVESLIRERQKHYYQVLAKSDKAGDCTVFLEFSLQALHDAVSEFSSSFRPLRQSMEERLQVAQERFGEKEFSRKDYLELFKLVSTATASRDLAQGVAKKKLLRRGEKSLARYRFR